MQFTLLLLRSLSLRSLLLLQSLRFALIFTLRFIFVFFCILSSLLAATVRVPILTYHNFSPTMPGSMTISPAKFEEQLKWLKENGYTIIPLQELVEYIEGKRASLPNKSIIITVDDGRKSVYRYLLPLVVKYRFPVTLFIYPSAISNASYALTWEQLKTLHKTGLFDIQSHTYWHPNFNYEKKQLTPSEYQQLVHVQLTNSKKLLEKKLGIKISLLAWPYGIYNNYLGEEAKKAGYTMAFTIDDWCANKSENAMAQPRYMIPATQSMKTFAVIVRCRMTT